MNLTAFITTIGASTFPRCLQHLEAQLELCRIEVIANVSPMAAAQRQMAERCETDFFLQVDEDMLLYPDATKRMLALIADEPATIAAGFAPLYDHELAMPIYGLKVWRTAAVRAVPFSEHVTYDRYHRAQLSEVGYSFVKLPRTHENCVGDHGTEYTPEQRFTRWRRLWQKQRHGGGKDWVHDFLPTLVARYRKSGSVSDLYALVGAITGAIEAPWPEDHDPFDASQADEELARLLDLFPIS